MALAKYFGASLAFNDRLDSGYRPVSAVLATGDVYGTYIIKAEMVLNQRWTDGHFPIYCSYSLLHKWLLNLNHQWYPSDRSYIK